jgi:hypothetical protein
MAIPKPVNQYRGQPLTIGTPTDFTKPLILELFHKGQGKKVLKLLYSVNLKVKEIYKKPGFKLYATNNNKKRKWK